MAKEDTQEETFYTCHVHAIITTMDGKPFTEQQNKWDNLDYEGVVKLEAIWMKMMQELTKLGQDKLDEKKNK